MENKSRYNLFIERIFENNNEVNIVQVNDNLRYDFVISYKRKKYNIEIKRTFSTINISRIIHFRKRVFYGQQVIKELYDFNSEEPNEDIIIFFDKIPEKIKNEYDINGIHIWDISNLFYIIQKDESLVEELIEMSDFSLNSIIPEENRLGLKIDYVERKKESKYEEDCIVMLEKIKCGKKDAYLYEKLCEKIIKEIFRKDLGNFKPQLRTNQSLNIFDLIAKIKKNTDNEFFKTIEEFYNTKYIVFEYKNYKEKISQIQVCSTEKYLYASALRNVAIIFSRKGLNKNASRMISGILREYGKLIIVLDDNDLKEMITLNKSNDDPTIVLINKLDNILMTLEK